MTVMEQSAKSKRKSEDNNEVTTNKKQHRYSEITFSNIGADSTHVEDLNNSELIDRLTEMSNQNSSLEEGSIDDSLVKTVVTLYDYSSEEKSALQELVKNLQTIISSKNNEIKELEAENDTLEKKLSALKDEMNDLKIATSEEKVMIKKYKRTILKLNE